LAVVVHFGTADFGHRSIQKEIINVQKELLDIQKELSNIRKELSDIEKELLDIEKELLDRECKRECKILCVNSQGELSFSRFNLSL
jgi:predicted  nucleic acid-binding Zn-ribbon protein